MFFFVRIFVPLGENADHFHIQFRQIYYGTNITDQMFSQLSINFSWDRLFALYNAGLVCVAQRYVITFVGI